MTAGEWIALGFGGVSLVGGWLLLFFKIGRAVGEIKEDTTVKIAEAREEHASEIAQLRDDFLRDQKAQDHNFGEVGAAMREKISSVEKEMHQIEIWGRDNFVRIENFDELRTDIKTMAHDIKQDFVELHRKIDAKS